MTRQLTNAFLIAGLSALLGAAVVNAQDRSEKANIPFVFHTQQTTFEAGKYTVQERTSTGLFLLRSDETANAVLMQMHPGPSADPEKPKLIFACYGHYCALAEISMEGSDVTYALPDSAIEKNLKHKLGISSMISVPLKGR